MAHKYACNKVVKAITAAVTEVSAERQTIVVWWLWDSPQICTRGKFPVLFRNPRESSSRTRAKTLHFSSTDVLKDVVGTWGSKRTQPVTLITVCRYRRWQQAGSRLVDVWSPPRRAAARPPCDWRSLRGVTTTNCHREASRHHRSARTTADASRRPQPAADAGEDAAHEMTAAGRDQDCSRRRTARRGQQTPLKASPDFTR